MITIKELEALEKERTKTDYVIPTYKIINKLNQISFPMAQELSNWDSRVQLWTALTILNSMNIQYLKLWDIPEWNENQSKTKYYNFTFLKNQKTIRSLDLSECTGGIQLDAITQN